MNTQPNIQKIEANPVAFHYLTVLQFTAKYKAFTVGGMRGLIFNEHSNVRRYYPPWPENSNRRS